MAGDRGFGQCYLALGIGSTVLVQVPQDARRGGSTAASRRLSAVVSRKLGASLSINALLPGGTAALLIRSVKSGSCERCRCPRMRAGVVLWHPGVLLW